MTHQPEITCHPGRQFGRPCIVGTRIPAETIAEMHWAGDGVAEIVDAYNIDPLDVLWCCAWWVLDGGLRPRRGRRRMQWHLWADHALRVLGGWTEGVDLCDPDEYADPLEGR